MLLILLTLLSPETLSWQYPHFSPGPRWLYPDNILVVLLKPNGLTVNLSLDHPPPSPAPWWLRCAISFPHLPRPPRPRDFILTISILVTLLISSSSFSWTRWCLLLWHSPYRIFLDPGDFIVTLSLPNPLRSPRPCDFILTISLPHPPSSPTQWLHSDALLSWSSTSSFNLITSLWHLIPLVHPELVALLWQYPFFILLVLLSPDTLSLQYPHCDTSIWPLDFILTLSLPHPPGPPRPRDFVLTISLSLPPRSPIQ